MICLIYFILKGFNIFNSIIDKNIIITKDINNIDINENKRNIIGKKNKKYISNKNEIDNIIKNNNNPTKKRKMKINKNSSNINIMKTNEGNINNKSSSLVDINNNKKLKINKEERIEDTYNDYEINSLIYKEAIKFDKRTYIEYYFSLLRIKHILLFTFYISNDFNSKCIKIGLFLFSLALYYTINTLFFDDATMHKIYIDEGKYNFIYQLPNILYSTLISNVIYIIIKYFSLPKIKFFEMRNNNEKDKNTQTTLNTLVDEDYRLGRGILDDFRPNAYKTQVGIVGNTTTNVITSSTIPNVTTPVITTTPVVSTTANVGGNNQLNAFL